MKQVVKSLVVVGAMMAAGSVAAEMDMDFKPFLGVDYLQAWMEGIGTITRTNLNARDAFKKSYSGATIYVGTKFTDNFGVEFGANSSAKEKRSVTGTVNGVTATYANKARRESFYADLVGFLPMDNCWELFGSLGYGSVKLKLTDQTLVAVSAANQTAVNAASPLPLSTKRKGVFRVGLGASYMFTEVFGVRAKLGWEGTEALRLKYANNFAAESKSFKNSTTLAVGAFVRW